MEKLFGLILLLASCASVQTLDGGEKDITPPQVLETSPDSASTSIQTNVFTFEFNEYIKANKINDLLIISPSQKINPTTKIKGKKLYITLNDTLLENTTYTFQFNGCIADINEGNALQNYSYVLSTGTYLDSLTHTGYIKDIQTNTSCTDCNIHLYTSDNDSVILSTKPEYVAKTDEKGQFTFYNLPDKSFKRIAIQDANKNLLLDKEEQVSLSKDIYSIKKLKDTITIFPTPNTDPIKPKLAKKTSPGNLLILLNKPIVKDSTQLLINNKQSEFKLSKSLDSVSTYLTPISDTSQITFIHNTDTTEFKYILPLSKLKYKVKTSYTFSDSLVSIYTNTRILSIDSTKLSLYKDTIPLPTTIKQIRENCIQLYSAKNSKPTHVFLQKRAITDIFNKTNKGDTTAIKINEVRSLLSVTYNVSDSTHYIIRVLVNNKPQATHYINSSKTITYQNLRSGEYKIQIIKDLNNNGIWDTGNLFTNKEPEPIQLSKPIEIRKNWDKSLIINVL